MVPIKGFIKTSLIEWEGKIVSIIFLSQCNLRCQYCHSPHLVNSPNELETIPVESVLESVRNNKGWIDGVVISGGEPTLNKGLGEFIKEFKKIGKKVKLDTNGTNPGVLENLIDQKLLDYVAMDIKAPLVKEKYESVAGIDLNVEDIKRSISIIMGSGIDYEFRTTVCPEFLNKADIKSMALSISGAKRYILQQFRPNICLNSELLETTPYTEEELDEFATVAGELVEKCWVRGKETVPRDRAW